MSCIFLRFCYDMSETFDGHEIDCKFYHVGLLLCFLFFHDLECIILDIHLHEIGQNLHQIEIVLCPAWYALASSHALKSYDTLLEFSLGVGYEHRALSCRWTSGL